ncbi:MAG: U32 family peptidase C-terminal domain-containing protein, partial [Clostridia bacterium]|nr:U32 family peptidase C-terminal domain-containing protein [Clostridia bacterium]
FLFNANDLNMIEHLPELALAGVHSFKIEGRAKAAYYAAVTTNAYRAAVDGWETAGFAADYRPAAWIVEELNKVSHRPYSTGFYYDTPAQNLAFGGYVRDYQVAAVALEAKDGWLTVSQRNRFVKGETLEVLEPGRPPYALPVTELVDEEGNPIEAAPHPTMLCRIPCDHPIQPGSLLRREV